MAVYVSLSLLGSFAYYRCYYLQNVSPNYLVSVTVSDQGSVAPELTRNKSCMLASTILELQFN